MRMTDVHRFRGRVSGCESFVRTALGRNKRNQRSGIVEARRVDSWNDNHVPLDVLDALFTLVSNDELC